MEESTEFSKPFDAAWAEIQRLNLEPYVSELDSQGFTVIPPELACPDGLHERLLEALMDVAERRSGTRPDLVNGSTHEMYEGRFGSYVGLKGDSPIGEFLQSLLFEGRVFEEALMYPVLLAMTTYLCGYSVVLSGMGCFIKGRNKTTFPFHSDTLMPSPLPPQSLVCNATYLLTDFTLENGATAFLPGSHKFCREPSGEETIVGGEHGNPNAVPATGPPGSLLVWHGNTWHGAFNRVNSGLRVSMTVLMARPCMRTEEDLHGKIPQEMLDRNSSRFAMLTQHGISYGFSSQEESVERSATAARCKKKYFEEERLENEERIAFPLYG